MKATFPAFNKVVAASADTQYEVTVPRGTKQFAIYTNEDLAIRVSSKAGEVATPLDEYLAIPSGEQYFVTDILLTEDQTFYVATASGTDVDIILHYWS